MQRIKATEYESDCGSMTIKLLKPMYDLAIETLLYQLIEEDLAGGL